MLRNWITELNGKIHKSDQLTTVVAQIYLDEAHKRLGNINPSLMYIDSSVVRRLSEAMLKIDDEIADVYKPFINIYIYTREKLLLHGWTSILAEGHEFMGFTPSMVNHIYRLFSKLPSCLKEYVVTGKETK